MKEMWEERKPLVIAGGIVIVLLILLSVKCSGGDPAPTGANTASTGTTLPSTPVSTPGTTAVVNDGRAQFKRPAATPVPAWWFGLFSGVANPFAEKGRIGAWTDPTNSDMDQASVDALTTAGKSVVSAQLTGQGRDEFPTFFANVGARTVPVTDVTIHGTAVAKGTKIAEGWAWVAVLWSGDVTDANGTVKRVTQFSEIPFQKNADGSWSPHQCSDTGVAGTCETKVLESTPLP